MRISDWSSDVCSSDLEEAAQHRCASLLLHAADHLRAVVAGRLLEDARAMVDAAALGIVGAVHQPAEPGKADRRRAHRTGLQRHVRSEEHTSELQSLMRISYAVFCLKKKKNDINT